MESGDLVIVRLYGREHEEPATVIKRRNFSDGEQSAIQILWKGRLRWVHNSKLRPLNKPECGVTVSHGEGGTTSEME